MEKAQNIAGIVVAGGLSQRLGEDKRRLRLWGEAGPTLLEHTLQVLRPLCTELIVVLNDAEAWPGLPARIVADAYPDGGSLGGIYSGLRAMQSDLALVVAADMPLLSVALLEALLALPFAGDALVPRARHSASRSGYEPLHALYRRSCLPAMHAALEAQRPQIASVLRELELSAPPAAVLAQYDPLGIAMLNINTQEDLAYAREMLKMAE